MKDIGAESRWHTSSMVTKVGDFLHDHADELNRFSTALLLSVSPKSSTQLRFNNVEGDNVAVPDAGGCENRDMPDSNVVVASLFLSELSVKLSESELLHGGPCLPWLRSSGYLNISIPDTQLPQSNNGDQIDNEIHAFSLTVIGEIEDAGTGNRACDFNCEVTMVSSSFFELFILEIFTDRPADRPGSDLRVLVYQKV